MLEMLVRLQFQWGMVALFVTLEQIVYDFECVNPVFCLAGA